MNRYERVKAHHDKLLVAFGAAKERYVCPECEILVDYSEYIAGEVIPCLLCDATMQRVYVVDADSVDAAAAECKETKDEEGD
ncbi:MAG: hypothetical protein JXA69_14645 [Phycisphaerae bacterium]|nr:hypothetical protein [Phycisphaerae bacterium]